MSFPPFFFLSHLLFIYLFFPRDLAALHAGAIKLALLDIYVRLKGARRQRTSSRQWRGGGGPVCRCVFFQPVTRTHLALASR